MYHRIEHLKRDVWDLAVSPDNFQVQLKLIKERHVVLPLDELVRLNKKGRAPSNSVAITFDDGYKDNLRNAAPLLSATGIPATLFLATGPMRTKQEYWWDRLASMVFDSQDVSGRISIGPECIEIVLGDRSVSDPVNVDWRACQPPGTMREKMYMKLWSYIRNLEPHVAKAVMSELNEIMPVQSDTLNEPMTFDEVKTLIERSTFTLGCHTVDHPDLTSLPHEMALKQIVIGKADVEAISGCVVAGFSYPYGRVDMNVQRLVEQAGFDYACVTKVGRLSQSSQYLLPRCTAQNVPSIDWISL